MAVTGAVAITPGDGANVATYDITENSEAKVLQRVVLNDGSGNTINLGGSTVSVAVTPTVTINNSYGENYVVGGVLTFSNAFTPTGSGKLQSVRVTCKQIESFLDLTLFLFNSLPATVFTDNTQASISAVDVNKVLFPLKLATPYSNLGTHTVWGLDGIGKAISLGTNNQTLYGVLLANGMLANNFTSTGDITVELTILQDNN